MADPEHSWPENAPGRYFVDEGCIDCDLCRTTAPHNFARSEDGYSYLAKQPDGETERQDCKLALADCPVEAIGERDTSQE